MTRQNYADLMSAAAKRLHAGRDDQRAYNLTLAALSEAWSAQHNLPRPLIVSALDKPGTQRVVLAQRLPSVVG